MYLNRVREAVEAVMSGRFLRSVLGSLAAVGAAVFLAGCGDSPLIPAPTAPTGTSSTGAARAPFILTVAPDGSVGYVSGSGTALLAHGKKHKHSRDNGSLSASADIDGSVGGQLQCGRFILTVPPGAFDGVGTITMQMDDSTRAVVDLWIDPGELNGFQVPVELSFDHRGLPIKGKLELYWLDSTDWVDLNTAPEKGSGLPTAQLQHFSRYAAGKAGW